MPWHDGWHMGWMGLGWVLLAACLFLVGGMAFAPRPGRKGESPETTLKRRYAAGEIDQEEYDRKLHHLRK